jgi:hypothetical protein
MNNNDYQVLPYKTQKVITQAKLLMKIKMKIKLKKLRVIWTILDPIMIESNPLLRNKNLILKK